MKVLVERCWSSSGGFWFHLRIPYHGGVNRDSIPGSSWNRATARQALNLLENVYGLPRRKVRFVHR